MKKHRNIKQYGTMILLLLALLCLPVLPFSALAAPISGEDAPAPLTGGIPVVVQIVGEQPPTPEVYTIRLAAVDQAPLPGSAAGNYLDLVLIGPGVASFPSFSYRAAGVYRYTIFQIAGGLSGASYDAGVYQVTVTVTNAVSGDGLQTTVVLSKDGKKQDAASFTNAYVLNPVEDPIAPGPDIDVPVNPPDEEPEYGPIDEPPAEPDDPPVEPYDPPAEPDDPYRVLDGPTPVPPDTLPEDVTVEFPEDAPVDEPPAEPPAEPDDPATPDGSQTGTLIQTGQRVRPVRLLGCAGIVLIALGGILLGRNRNRSRKGRDAE